MIELDELTTKLVAATEPKLTELAPDRPVPTIVTVVAPVATPTAGLSELTTGTAR